MNRLITSIALLLAAVSCRPSVQGQADASGPSPVKVTIMEVGRSHAVNRNSYVGEVSASRSITLSAPYNGTLASLDVRKGDRVEAGQVIACISSQNVESSLEIARATLNQARDAYSRAKKVYDNGSISELQFVDIQTQLTKAEAAAAAAEKALSDASVRAPYAGVVGDVHADAGVDVGIAQRLVTILDMNDLRIDISIHENDIKDISRGDRALVDIPALGLEGLDARVTDKGLVASMLSHSYGVSLKLSRPVKDLMPGMAVKVRFSSEGPEAIVIPAAAVLLDNEGRYVWLDDAGTVRKAHIEVGGYSGRGIIVSEGLEPGDKVITEGFQKVSSGMKVCE